MPYKNPRRMHSCHPGPKKLGNEQRFFFIITNENQSSFPKRKDIFIFTDVSDKFIEKLKNYNLKHCTIILLHPDYTQEDLENKISSSCVIRKPGNLKDLKEYIETL